MTLNGIVLLGVAAFLPLCAGAQETLRGRFDIELEPVSAMEAGVPYPLDAATARRRALEEAARVFAGMIYGWNYDYSIGDRSRAVDEWFELEAQGAIAFGDPRLSVTEAETQDSSFRIWAEYRLDEAQLRAFAVGREGSARLAQGTGSAPLSKGPAGKKAALDDAARIAVRSVLVGSERNRPKESFGTAILVDVPRYWVDEGRYMCSARFRVAVKEIVPYRFF